MSQTPAKGIFTDESDPREDESESFLANQMARIRCRWGKIEAGYRYYDLFAGGSIVSDHPLRETW